MTLNDLKQEKIVLFILACVQFTNILDYMIMLPLGPQLMVRFHISPQAFGHLVSAYNFSACLASLFIAFYIDHFDRKKSLLVVYSGFMLATLFCALANQYDVLLLARICAGACGGVLEAIVFSIISDLIIESRRGRATGVIMSAFSLASVLGIPISIFLATHLDWRMPFVMIIGIASLVFLLAFQKIPAVTAHLGEKTRLRDVQHWQQLKIIFGEKQHLKAFLFIMFLMLSSFSIIPFINPYFVLNLGINEVELGYFYMVGGALSFFTGPWIGRLADRYGKRKMFTIMATLALIPMLFLTHLEQIISFFKLEQVRVYVALLSMVLFMVIVSGRFAPAMSLITMSVNPKSRGSFFSFNAAVDQASCGMATFFAGLVIVKNPNTQQLMHYDTVGWCAFIFSVICIILSYQLKTYILSTEKTISSTP